MFTKQIPIQSGFGSSKSVSEVIRGLDEHGKPILDPSKNLKTVGQGAATSVWCTTSPQLNGIGGVYCENTV